MAFRIATLCSLVNRSENSTFALRLEEWCSIVLRDIKTTRWHNRKNTIDIMRPYTVRICKKTTYNATHDSSCNMNSYQQAHTHKKKKSEIMPCSSKFLQFVFIKTLEFMQPVLYEL
jgi:hypothetical protein